MKISIVEGVLAEFDKADVIVNSTNQSLRLNHGTLSSSLAKVAGPGLQAECDQRYRGLISYGQVATTSGHGLNCKRLYHVAVPPWDLDAVDPQMVMIQTMYSCLEEAHKERMTSIAFPTLGCGFLGYPPDIVASTLNQCISMFETTYTVSTLREVYVVLYTKAKDWKHIRQAFQFQFNDIKSEEREQEKEVEPFLQDFSKTCARESARNSCRKTLSCGHVCGGYKNESQCPPCIQKDCLSGSKAQTGEDNCSICYTDPLSSAPIISLECGHIYHLRCVKRILQNRWVGPRITFNFIRCPVCKKRMNHPELESLLMPIYQLNEEVKSKALMRLKFEGLDRSREITNRTSPYYNNPAEFAMDRYCYYSCFKCKTAYFGGSAQCEAGLEDRMVKAEDMVCPACSGPQMTQNCSKHGTEFIEYKCRYCCSIAVFFCFGKIHFCNACHNSYFKMGLKMLCNRLPRCPAGPCGKQLNGKCPLGIQHPPTGEEFCLGCGLCKNLQTF